MRLTTYTHACDASAAAVISGTRLFVAASDEDCVLRVYDLDNPGSPVSSSDVTAFLEPDDPSETEADIEGAAQLGDRIFWIGSHGRSKKGKERRIRQRLFATVMDLAGAGMSLKPFGTPYKELLSDLASSPHLTRFNLGAAAKKPPEEEGALNIEGLAATPDGNLLIGFRNPIVDGRALVVKIGNAPALVDGTATRADVSLVGLLDLGGRGIRAFEFVPRRGTYLVLAGAFDDSGNFQVYGWSGAADSPPRALALDIGDLKPEELIALQATSSRLVVHLLSDDGSDECKAAKDTALKTFRGSTAELTF